jgi:Na+-driven multidrug efflux pump
VAQPLILSFADTRAHFYLVLRFLCGLCLLTAAGILILCLPSAREFIFEGVMKVDNQHILKLTYAALPWTLLVVPVQLASMLANSLVLRSGDTRVLISSGLLALLPVAMIPLLVDIPAANGVIITIGAYILYHASNALLLALHLRRRGLDACFEGREKLDASPA